MGKRMKIEPYKLCFVSIEKMQSEFHKCFAAKMIITFTVTKDGEKGYENMFEVSCRLIDQDGEIFLTSGAYCRDEPPFTPSFTGCHCSEQAKEHAERVCPAEYREIAEALYKPGTLEALYYSLHYSLTDGYTMCRNQSAFKFLS